MPPRTAASEYLAHTQIGPISIGAEFVGHSVPTPQANYTTEDYVIVEVGIFGPPDARLRMSVNDFSLRINGKKSPIASQHYELSFHSFELALCQRCAYRSLRRDYVDVPQQQQRRRLVASPALRRSRLLPDDGAIIGVGTDTDGTYKLRLKDGNMRQVSASTFVGTVR